MLFKPPTCQTRSTAATSKSTATAESTATARSPVSEWVQNIWETASAWIQQNTFIRKEKVNFGLKKYLFLFRKQRQCVSNFKYWIDLVLSRNKKINQMKNSKMFFLLFELQKLKFFWIFSKKVIPELPPDPRFPNEFKISEKPPPPEFNKTYHLQRKHWYKNLKNMFWK